MHQLEELALIGALAFGAYELYHLHHYGNFGIGNPYHHGIGIGGYGAPSNGFGYSPYSHHHGHHHHHIF